MTPQTHLSPSIRERFGVSPDRTLFFPESRSAALRVPAGRGLSWSRSSPSP
jgi:hypothetical protein